MTIYRSIDNLLELLGSQKLDDIKVTVYRGEPAEEEMETVSTFENYKMRLSVLYGEATVCLKATEDTDSAAVAAFKSLWNTHFRDDSNMVQWGYIYRAMTDKYNPQENYDRHSEITTEYLGKELSGAKSSTKPNVGSTADFVETDKSDAERSFDNRKDKVTDYTHGNIGVQDVPTMLMHEMDARKTDLTVYLLSRFVFTYCF